MEFLTILQAVILFLLGLIHLYWVLGGKWGLKSATPDRSDGTGKVFNPGPIATILVFIGLMGFGFLTLSNLFPALIPSDGIRQNSLGLIAFLFLARAFGDFKYVGFTKRVKDTAFARYDTQVFIPICLMIGSISFVLFLHYGS